MEPRQPKQKKNSPSLFPDNDCYFSLRQCLIDICDGDHCAASLLDVLIYWSGVRKKQVEQEKIRASSDKDYAPNLEMWIYKSSQDWSDDLRGHYGETSIRTGLKLISSKGFTKTRSNPKNSLDRTPQYLLIYAAIKSAIYAPSDPVKTTDAPREINTGDPVKTTDADVENEGCLYTEVTTSEVTSTEIPPTPFQESEPKTPEDPGATLDEEDSGAEPRKPFKRQWSRKKEPKPMSYTEAALKRMRGSESNGASPRPEIPVPVAAAPVTPAIDFPARWNELVPARPTVWNQARDSWRGAGVFSDPEFAAKFDDLCRTCQKFITAKPDADWVHFRWIIGAKDGHPNWHRVDSEEFQIREKRHGSGKQPGLSTEEVLDYAKKRREEYETRKKSASQGS